MSPRSPIVGADDKSRPVGSVAVRTASFAGRDDALRAELELGQLIADSVVDLLDGVVVWWPSDARWPCWRTVRNVPRFGALTTTGWEEYLGCRVLPGPTRYEPLPVGSDAIVALVAPLDAPLVERHFCALGARVSSHQLDSDAYHRLRQRH